MAVELKSLDMLSLMQFKEAMSLTAERMGQYVEREVKQLTQKGAR